MTFHLIALRQGRRLKTVAAAAAMLLASAGAGAINLQQAYQQALQNDPTYRAAFYENQSGKESAILGRAGLLPNVQANYNASKNRADIQTPTSVTEPEYISRVSTIQLRQALFNVDAYARFKQGKAQAMLSDQMFSVRGQELLLRVIGAYFDALFTDEQVALIQAQRDAYMEQSAVNERLLKHGEGTRTDVLEVQARLELAEAQLIEAKDNQATARNALTGMVGGDIGNLVGLNDTFRMLPLAPTGVEEWKALALKQNPELAAQTIALEVAKQEILKARAGHAPRLDFVASYSKNTSETINTYNQESTVRAIGIQLNVPLYAGGAVNASSRQAVAGLERARADLQAKTDKALIEVSKQFSAVQSGTAKVNALNRAVESSNLLIKATEQSIKGGVRINLDLLNAQQQLFTAKRDLAQARYGYLLASLRLRAAAGTLGSDDVNRLASYFR
ncbi:TolC family outer membrane protein [Massilia sp. CCM 9210]|uniref:TolC family outer membrane protein n=1 Tax=Massilia scottii TaxID=3057166 RepID=UPI0027969836|nr:TolC family outer membrane protein [Massilia sp. CCM 9210]MDQ1817523.1 TolC family outer membrane protein [Massilia sp. CCM 9210]